MMSSVLYHDRVNVSGKDQGMVKGIVPCRVGTKVFIDWMYFFMRVMQTIRIAILHLGTSNRWTQKLSIAQPRILISQQRTLYIK
jgi:hypothetical protein